MYKMKEICEKTGLTERTVRYYIEEQLIQPIVEDGVYRKAYFFNEEHIQTLQNIAALRSVGFSIMEVKEVLQNPTKISAIVGKKEMEYEEEIDKIKKAKEILGNLSIEEHKDVSKLADAIHQRTPYHKETSCSQSSRKKWRKVYAVLFLIIMLIYFSLGISGVVWCGMLFFGVVGIWSLLMATAYLTYNFRYKKMKHHGVGKIVAVIDGNTVEKYLGESKWLNVVAFLSMGIVHWNWVRPDHWFSIIQFETPDKTVHTTTFRYGLLKKDWKIDDEVEIAWNEGEE